MQTTSIYKARAATALLVVAVLTPPAAAAERVTCSPTKITAIASETDRNTTSTTFVPLTEAGGKFVQGGSRPSCVLVRLEGYVAQAAANTAMSISATIDGNTIESSEVQLSYNDIVYVPRGWTFIIPSVAPGAHRIGFKFRSNNGNNVGFNDSITIIHHAQ